MTQKPPSNREACRFRTTKTGPRRRHEDTGGGWIKILKTHYHFGALVLRQTLNEGLGYMAINAPRHHTSATCPSHCHTALLPPCNHHTSELNLGTWVDQYSIYGPKMTMGNCYIHCYLSLVVWGPVVWGFCFSIFNRDPGKKGGKEKKSTPKYQTPPGPFKKKERKAPPAPIPPKRKGNLSCLGPLFDARSVSIWWPRGPRTPDALRSLRR